MFTFRLPFSVKWEWNMHRLPLPIPATALQMGGKVNREEGMEKIPLASPLTPHIHSLPTPLTTSSLTCTFYPHSSHHHPSHAHSTLTPHIHPHPSPRTLIPSPPPFTPHIHPLILHTHTSPLTLTLAPSSHTPHPLHAHPHPLTPTLTPHHTHLYEYRGMCQSIVQSQQQIRPVDEGGIMPPGRHHQVTISLSQMTWNHK